MELDPKALALFTEGYDKILQGIGLLGFDVHDENFADTAKRAAKGLHELIHDQKQARAEVEALLAKTFPAKYTEMVISKHNTCFGMCPHHLLPVIYRISMAYIPTETTVAWTPPAVTTSSFFSSLFNISACCFCFCCWGRISKK